MDSLTFLQLEYTARGGASAGGVGNSSYRYDLDVIGNKPSDCSRCKPCFETSWVGSSPFIRTRFRLLRGGQQGDVYRILEWKNANDYLAYYGEGWDIIQENVSHSALAAGIEKLIVAQTDTVIAIQNKSSECRGQEEWRVTFPAYFDGGTYPVEIWEIGVDGDCAENVLGNRILVYVMYDLFRESIVDQDDATYAGVKLYTDPVIRTPFRGGTGRWFTSTQRTGNRGMRFQVDNLGHIKRNLTRCPGDTLISNQTRSRPDSDVPFPSSPNPLSF